MAKEKERSVNPAQQQRKLEKAKALKKGKAEVQARRNEKLARRNPERLQRQVDDLKALEESGQIKSREKQILQELERDVNAIRKARETLGDKAPHFKSNRRPQDENDRRDSGVLGKRRWDGARKPYNQDGASSGSETDESVRRIPMPRDTPPPIPQQNRRNNRHGTNANSEPLGNHDRGLHALPGKPAFVPEAKTTYESAPQVRDLKREAVSRFVPNIVRTKQDAVKGKGGLVEPEEFDRLEREGYVAAGGGSTTTPSMPRVDDTDVPATAETEEARRLAEEEERFRRELLSVQAEEEAPNQAQQESHQVQIEDVSDEDL